ncbi:MAG TPA: hypothetical protein VMI31_02220, partial [Fimbriimonadaceae bacterium]|nr:hypothetical protein [Fimbriimonadaceae bacterium]
GIPSSLNPNDFARVVPDEPFELFDGNSLLVEALLRQSLLLALPMQPLCEYGWDGPCPIAAQRGVEAHSEAAGKSGLEELSQFLHREDMRP